MMDMGGEPMIVRGLVETMKRHLQEHSGNPLLNKGLQTTIIKTELLTMKTKEITKFRDTYKDYNNRCYFEGFKLAVLFDEKDAVKRYGAKWNQDKKIWWMPVDQLTVDVHAGIGTVRDWLNDHKMIVGQYGKFTENEYTSNLFSEDNTHYTEYGLKNFANARSYKVQFFYGEDVTKFIPDNMGALTEYLTIEDGRKRWNEFIDAGYNRVENS